MVILIVAFLYCYAEFCFDESQYVEFRYGACRYAERCADHIVRYLQHTYPNVLACHLPRAFKAFKPKQILQPRLEREREKDRSIEREKKRKKE